MFSKRKFNQTGILLGICSGLCITTVYAKQKPNPAFHITGTTLATIKTKKDKGGEKSEKTIGLLKIIPSEKFVTSKKDLLKKYESEDIERDYSFGIVPFAKSQGAVDIGMNGVPVLDQGAYGTCVTFATTAAMNAVLKKDDFISQQCTLQLNRMLGQDLWNGAYFSSQIIDPLQKYGLVKQGKGTEQEGKCNSEYPNIFGLITISGYKNRAKNSGENASNIKYRYFSTIKLDNIRKAIDAKHRVAIGFGLVASEDSISVQGFDTTIDGKKTAGGLWACKQPSSKTNYCGRPNSGHEVIVIGYDDTQELLKIRNSWNTSVGDEGDFYMSYFYFETMVFDGTEIY